jgi:hypothetical protein
MNKTESKKPWFDVDRTGLRKLLEDRGVEFAVFELIQNAWDEAGVTRVEVTLKPVSKRLAMLTVQDDAPEGFKDLRHAYTLFAESAKKSNAEQRGRFNIGEKLVLALCEHALIKTTKGTVHFDKNGTRREERESTMFGSIFSALIEFDENAIEKVSLEVRKLLPPTGIATVFNGEEIAPRNPRHQVECILDTDIADSQGVMRRTSRKTVVHCHEPLANEKAMIYEMGIPVVEHDNAFHCDVMQKVPLTLDRKNVAGYFLKRLRLEVFNATHDELTTEQVNARWVQAAAEQKDAAPEAVSDYMTKRFGEHRVSWDMNDPEANSRATAAGFTVVKGGMMSGDLWSNVKEHGAIEPAGALFPTHSDNFVAFEPADLTDDMRRVARYTVKLSECLMGFKVRVEFGEQRSREAACYGNRRLQFNVTNLGKGWFNLDGNRLAIDDLVVHEFGHEYESNHLSDNYNNALSKLAAKAMALGRAGKLPE